MVAQFAGRTADREGMQRLPGLEPVRELGRGAGSVVYEARRTAGPGRTGEHYAVKVLTGPAGAGRTAALCREATLLACLDHPGLVKIHEVATVDGRPHLVMDLVHGQTLTEILARGPLPADRAAGLGAELADALTSAHSAGLVHRDLKPDNIMVTTAGYARLLDFGLATRAGDQDEDAAVGTFLYAAPEQTGALRRMVDARADLYALGVVLFECVTGVPPFTAPDVAELVRMHLAVPAPDLASVAPGTPPALARVVARLLAKDPDDRYQSAQGLSADLERIRAGEHEPFPLDTAGAAREMPGSRSLIGRAAEAAQLAARWRRAAAGYGGMALVSGPAGGGRGRLVRELAATVRAGHGVTLHGKAVAEGSVPLAALRDMIEGYARRARSRGGPEGEAARRRLRELVAPTAALLRAVSPTLATMVDAADLPGGDYETQLAEAVTAFLTGLARTENGLLLHLDDVQWCDPGSRQVLRRLAAVASDVPLLLVATARDDEDCRAAVAAFEADMGGALDVRISLAPLDEAAIAALLTAELGASAPPAALLARLAGRGGGNPLAALEYLHAVIDAGLLRPSWGGWVLEESGLAAIPLAAEVMDLVLRRIDSVGPRAREVLTVAAAVGVRFPLPLVAAAAGLDVEDARGLLAEAVSRHLIEMAPGGGYLFVHDRVREALLGGLDEAARRDTHQRIAEQWGRLGGGDGTAAYEIARHYLRGRVGDTPDRAVAAAVAAGRLALRQQAPTMALDLLTAAARVAAEHGVALDTRFHADLGQAASTTGDYPLAVAELHAALEAETDELRRALIHTHLARTYMMRLQGHDAFTAAGHGLAELGHPLPERPRQWILSTIGQVGWGLALSALPARLRVASGEEAERLRRRLVLVDACAAAANVALRVPATGALALRTLPLAQRLADGPEYLLAQTTLGTLEALMGRLRQADRRMERAIAAAVPLGDPRLIAQMRMNQSIYYDAMQPMSATTGDYLERMLRTEGQWLDAGPYFAAAGLLQVYSTYRGDLRRATEWQQRAREVGAGSGLLTDSFAGVADAVIAALAGRPAEAASRLAEMRAQVDANPGNAMLRVSVAAAAMFVLLEQNEHGEEFDKAVAAFHATGITVRSAVGPIRCAWMVRAFGRLARAAALPADARGEALEQAGKAVAALGHAANGPVLKAAHGVARASLRQLCGDDKAALAGLARLDDAAADLDMPVLEYEIARVRARACRALDRPGPASRHARTALMIATDHGWPVRARWIRAEFDVSAGPSTHQTSSAVVGRGDLTQRRFDALREVSVAASTVLDPAEVTRVALDEIIRILGAERAFLFTADDADELLPYLGRDSAGADIEQLTGYGSSLVERVHATGTPLVVTGSDEGAALGSLSTVAHGLRSIMVAPLLLKGRTLGVVYLDSRVAKGVFAGADLELLQAIINHVAVALETARAAQLEVAVEATRRERDTARTLHRTMSRLIADLDLEQVTSTLLGTVRELLNVDQAVLLHRQSEAEKYTVVGAGPLDGAPVDTGADPRLTALLATANVTSGTDPLPDLLGPGTFTWLALPLTVRGEHRGLILAAAAGDRRYTEAEVDLAVALAGQGTIALENALLFRQTQDLAIRDGLTGLFNRRHFFHLATRYLSARQRNPEPHAVAMIDIDHFKRVNDTYGHAVGDDVIREVAYRLERACREADVLCRYGGEEFAILLQTCRPEAARAAAARVHAAVTETPVPTGAGPLEITISVGLAVADDRTEDLQTLLNHADAALYDAKRAGRDRVVQHRAVSS
ncbi:hypothetical protein Asp14428_75610 [Actinoplanes sp. NBRC 14428]|nr:hypothetical protein Asp14428_75610 [Actinoplanes sp. NBRC 14428]